MALTKPINAAAATADSGPIVASFDFATYDPAEMTAVVDYWWPESLGLSDNSSLAQLLNSTWGLWQQQNPPSEWLPPQPDPDFNAGSISVTSDGGKGSVLSLTVPMPSDEGGATTTGVPVILANILAQLAGALAAAGALAVCGAYLFGIPTNDSGWKPEFGNARPWTTRVCSGTLTAVWGAIATITGNYLTKGDDSVTGFPYPSLIGTILGGYAAGFSFPFAGALVKAVQYAWLGVLAWVNTTSAPPLPGRLLDWLTPYLSSDQLAGFYTVVNNLSNEQIRQMSNPLAAAKVFGFWTPAASGYVGNVPTGAAVTVGSGDCIDAWESSQTEPTAPPAVPGQSVAIGPCIGSPAQVFTFWPNGQIENWGLCMDDDGDSSSSDRPVVNLQVCDGGYTQLWYENGAGEIVNDATGNCLDDPNSNTTAGTQLRVFPCNGTSAQQWAPPSGTAAVTGLGPILSVQSAGSQQYCMMPQTTLSNPVGSNIITESVNPSSDLCNSNNSERSWAVGSNGTLMANGTNALCLDSDGPSTTGPGGEAANFVQLQGCDGKQSQVWKVVSTFLGPTLQNAGDGLCINTPSGQPATLVSMVVASCANPPSTGELWTLPGSAGSNGSLTGGPCDIYAYYSTPCTAAYSMDRAMYASYDGPLYQVTRASDGTTANIGPLSTGGDVNASEQTSFCANTTCTISEIYDQSPKGNNLTIEGPGGVGGQDSGAVADALPVTIGGNKAYGLDIEPGTGYRDDATTGIATNGQPEGMYMVASGTHVNSQCCFDFGNVEVNNHDTGEGHMDAVNLTTYCGNNNPSPCSGGPSVEADLENGQWTGGSGANVEGGNSTPFVTAMLQNNGQNTFALEGGDSTSGGLTTWYDGALPSQYQPMHQEGAIVLGTGGDNSNSDVGSWFEGVMTQGFPSDTADKAVQANIVAADYAGTTNPAPSSVTSATASAAGQAVVHSAGATGAAASGFSSVYTVNSANGHLQETYLPAMGGSWNTQDLSANYGAPPIMAGTQPVAVVHCGFTSVFTVDAASGDLQETYLSAIGDPWATQDLSAIYGAPPTNVTPTAVVHTAGVSGASTGCGYTSVYTRDRNGDLQETYLPSAGFPGDPWHSQDLSANYGAPAIQPGTGPVAITHCGFTSVYTVDSSNHDLQETYLPAVGGGWLSQDLSANYGTPPTDVTPTAVVHTAGASGATTDCGFTSVYTVDQDSQHLQETYLPNAGFPGDPWNTQDLSAKYGTPQVAPGTSPVALVHMNFTSVFTVDQGSGHLRETYLPAIGGPWNNQDLSANYGTPATDQTPIVLLHPDTGGVLDWASVYTVDEFNSHLQETYLPNTGFPGDPWVTQDLSAKYGAPPVYQLQSSPASWSVVHDGYTSAFTADASDGHLDESYLTAMGQPWAAQDLSAKYGAPDVAQGTTPVAMYHDGYTSVYTVNAANHDLQETFLSAAASTGDPWATQDLSASFGTPQVSAGTSPAAAFHDGFVSLYTVDKNTGDLQETYLPSTGFPGDAWHTQDLRANYDIPPVMAGTSPVAVVHDGYVSVYTVDTNGDLQESYLPYMGDAWHTQDLSGNYGTPQTQVSPTAVFHDGYTSVYTVDWNGDLQESYLPYMGDRWSTQDLTANYGVPQAINVAPAALYHDGYTSVYYLTGPDDHLVESYLPALSGPWGYQDLSANFQTPPSVQSPSPLVHYDTSGGLTFASVYTTGASNGHLEETYLPDDGFPGDPWATQDLSAKYGTPAAAPPSSAVYVPSSDSEYLGYDRATRLEGTGSSNGTLLATFEHTTGSGGEGDYLIQQSTDDGSHWSNLSTVPAGDVKALAPFLYEFPQQLGNYPAGTLMLLGNTINASNTNAAIREWLSFNHGASWTYVGIVQSGGGPGDGVWEPFVTLDSSGHLAMLFSDERQNATYSQFIGEIISTDGGNTWTANPDGSTNFGPGEIKAVASAIQADRPGMPTVARMGLAGGNYIMSFEDCGPASCDVYTKTSPDGDNWGTSPSDMGTRAQTSNGLHLEVSPVITWVENGGADGTVYLTAHKEVTAGSPIPEGQTVILTNTNSGGGNWSTIAAPAIPSVGANPAVCNTNYSPDLTIAGNGTSLLYTTPAAVGPHNCDEITDPIPIAP